MTRPAAAAPSGGGADNVRWFHPFAEATQPDRPVPHGISASADGWQHTGLWVADLGASTSSSAGSAASPSSFGGPLTDVEAVVVPLSGVCRVTWRRGGETVTIELAGRPDVWSGPTDVAYLPAGEDAAYDVSGDGRVAVCTAAVRETDPAARPRHVTAGAVPVELRGAGVCSREVRNFATPATLPEAGRIIACEVITPAGNWSSYPPHKHDEERPGEETELEEIYYFETRATPGLSTPDPVGYHRVYGTADRPIDVVAEVRTGDVVLVPHGWHGPSIAAPDADLYYLNVMAGPGETREWLICDDPAHGGIRAAWESQEVDPRLGPVLTPRAAPRRAHG